MRRGWVVGGVLAGLFAAGNLALANPSINGGVWGIIEQWLPLSGGTLTGGVTVSGACSANSDDVVCYDNNGAQGGQRTTDAAPQGLLVKPQSAFPGGTQTASNLILAGGQDETKVTIDAFASCNAADTVTVTVIDSNGTSTATVLTYGTQWCTSGCGTDALTATSLATAIDAVAGVGSTASSSVARITLDASTAQVTLAESDAACSTVAVGTYGLVKSLGSVEIPDGSVSVPSIAFSSDADGTGTGIYRVSANNGGLAGNGLGVFAWSSTGVSVRPTATNAAVFQVGTAGTQYWLVDTQNNTVGNSGAMTSLITVARIGTMSFCGLGPNGATTVYMSPLIGSLMWGGRSAGDATACNAGSNTTEATADMPMFPYPIYPITMACGMEDVAVDTGVTFALRSATADVGANLTCTTSALDGSGTVTCSDINPAGGAKYTINAGATIAMRAVAASGNESTSNMYCTLTFGF